MKSIHRKLASIVFSVRESCALGLDLNDPSVARWNSDERWSALLFLKGSIQNALIWAHIDLGPHQEMERMT